MDLEDTFPYHNCNGTPCNSDSHFLYDPAPGKKLMAYSKRVVKDGLLTGLFPKV